MTAAALALAALLLHAGRASGEKAGPKDPLAGAVVRSKEYVVRRGRSKVEEFSGDVYYRSGGRELRSDWARYDHKTRVWKARGRVHALLRMKDASAVELWGEEAEHDALAGRGWLVGKDREHPVRFSRLGGAVEDQGFARRLEWDEERSIAWARGGVHAWGGRGEAWADAAEYRRAEQLLTLTGRRPVLVHHEPKWSSALQAERIEALEGERRLKADERVQGWILFKERPR